MNTYVHTYICMYSTSDYIAALDRCIILKAFMKLYGYIFTATLVVYPLACMEEPYTEQLSEPEH